MTQTSFFAHFSNSWFLEFSFLNFSLGMKTPKTRFSSLFNDSGSIFAFFWSKN